jgi:hypothetical protein
MAGIMRGDEVRVFYHRASRRREHPEGFPGTVTRAGAKYGTVTFMMPGTDSSGQQPREWEIRFDLETGFQSPDTEGLRVRTLGQVEQDERRKEALYWLDLAGLEPKLGRAASMPLEHLEALAEVIKSWDRKD